MLLVVTSFHENYGQGWGGGGGVPSASFAGEEVAYSGELIQGNVILRSYDWTHVKAGDQSKVDIIKFEKSLML